MFSDLARPENNLYLAGEIFGWPDNGYVHTAFASGLETAHRVISKIRITDRSRL